MALLRYVSTGTRIFGNCPFHPQNRNLWEFYAVIRGSIAPWFDVCRRETMHSKSLWLFPPDSVHGWIGVPDAPSRVAVFHFAKVPDALENLTKTGAVRVKINSEECERLHRMAKDVLVRLRHPNPLLEFYEQRILIDLALLMLKSSVAEEVSPSPGLDSVLAAEEWYRAHLAYTPSLDRMACETGLTKGHLRRLFHAAYSCSPKVRMRQIRFQAATHLLKTSDLKIEAISAECGFGRASVFFRQFKENFGVTPTEYRHGSNLRITKQAPVPSLSGQNSR